MTREESVQDTLTLVEKTAYLKSVPVLAGVPTEALAEIGSRATERRFDAGEEVHHEGDANTGAFMVLEGMIELRKGRALVRMISQGQAFGELFLNEGEPHQFTAIANTPAHLLNITVEDTFDTMLDYPEFATGMVRSLARRNLELIERLLELEGVLSRFHAALMEAGLEPPGTSGHEVAPSDVLGVIGVSKAD
jgi:CRP-like cAMP-binding protein